MKIIFHSPAMNRTTFCITALSKIEALCVCCKWLGQPEPAPPQLSSSALYMAPRFSMNLAYFNFIW